MGLFSSISRAILGPSDQELIEECTSAGQRYYSVPGRPSYIYEAETPDEKTIKRAGGELIARGYHWNGRRWIGDEEEGSDQ